MLHNFFKKHGAHLGEIREEDIEIGEILDTRGKGKPRLTEFSATDDIFLYSQLLAKLFSTLDAARETVFDLGAGSSLPVIKALLDAKPKTNIHVVSVDNDPSAIEVGRYNARLFGLQDNFIFEQADMFSWLRKQIPNPDHVFVANPPYLPSPRKSSSSVSLSVNGGEDGAKFLAPLLQFPFLPGTLVALQWSSLSSPAEIIRLIELNYEVLFVQAHKTPFGTYTGSPLLKPHLEGQREKGLSVFETDENGSHHFWFIGTILRRK